LPLLLVILAILAAVSVKGAIPVTDTISPPPDNPTTIIGLSELCQGQTAQYIADIPIACEVQWLVDGIPQTTANDTLEMTWTEAGSYLLSLEITCDTNTYPPSYLVVVVAPLPETPAPIAGDTEVCLFTTDSYTTEAAHDESCLWHVDGSIQNSTATTLELDWNEEGMHQIEVQANNTCGTSDATSLSVGVYAWPLVNLGNDTALIAGQILVLDAGNPGSNYLWSTGETTQTIAVVTSGVYVVVVNNGCGEASDEIQVQVIVGQDENKFRDGVEIKILGRTCEISVNFDAFKQIRVFDVAGNMISETSSPRFTLPHSGIFIVQITTNSGSFFSQKLVITQ